MRNYIKISAICLLCVISIDGIAQTKEETLEWWQLKGKDLVKISDYESIDGFMNEKSTSYQTRSLIYPEDPPTVTEFTTYYEQLDFDGDMEFNFTLENLEIILHYKITKEEYKSQGKEFNGRPKDPEFYDKESWNYKTKITIAYSDILIEELSVMENKTGGEIMDFFIPRDVFNYHGAEGIGDCCFRDSNIRYYYLNTSKGIILNEGLGFSSPTEIFYNKRIKIPINDNQSNRDNFPRVVKAIMNMAKLSGAKEGVNEKVLNRF